MPCFYPSYFVYFFLNCCRYSGIINNYLLTNTKNISYRPKRKKWNKKWRNCWKRLCIVSLQETNEFFSNVRYSNGKQNCLIFTAFMSFGRQTNREFLTFFNTTNTVFLVLISCIWAEQKVSAAAAAEATAVESR